MKVVISLLSIVLVIEVFRVSILLLRKDSSVFRLVFEFIILIGVITMYFVDICFMKVDEFNYICFCISIVLSLYVVFCFVFDFKDRRNFISVLSIKSAIDKSCNGIMFLNSKGNIFLINKVMEDVLDYYNISNNIISCLDSNVFKRVNNDRLLKCLDRIWLLKVYDDREIVVIDITDIYTLNEKLEFQNMILDEYNSKLLETLDNIEEINKSKNLIKIKNEFHDLLGHRLSLFKTYLNNGNTNLDDIKFMVSNLFYDDSSDFLPSDKLNKLIGIYDVLGISIKVDGVITDDDFGCVYFEIIREAVTNAIMHGGSKNIDISIDNNGMVIRNDGDVPRGDIHENEGIRGMRRKLNEIGGSLIIDVSDGFSLRISV